MPRKVRLPSEIMGGAIRTSESGELGLTRARLRGRDVQHPFHGSSAINVELDSVLGLCRAFEPVLRADQYFSHSTAAALHGMPLPATVPISPIHVSSSVPDHFPRRAGVTGHLFTGGRVNMVFGLPTIDAADAWFLLATELGFPDLVAAADFLVSGRRLPGGSRTPPLCTVGQLHDAALRYRGRRGSRAVFRALERVRSGVDSRMETRMRLLLEDSGIRNLVVGPAVLVDDEHAVLHPDLAIVSLRLCFEYEGDGHRTSKRQFRSDIRRRERIEAAGWRVVRVTLDDIFAGPEDFLARVHRIIDARIREL